MCGGSSIKSLFIRGPNPNLRMVFCTVLAVVLLYADHRYSWMDNIRAEASTVVAPVQWLVSLPAEGLGWASVNLSSQRTLIHENQVLRTQLNQMLHRTMQMEAIEAENNNLRQLLHAAPRGRIPFATAQLMMVDNDPFLQQLIIDRGAQQHVYVGQPVLDAFGVIGQVVSVERFTSQVLMVTDPSYAVPVQIIRNGLRFIAQGTGSSNDIEIMDVPNNSDIRVGDVMVTSGLGGEYPAGYPVATVTSVQTNTNGPFARVIAQPSAQVNRSRDFLLLYAQDVTSDDAGDEVSQQSIDVANKLVHPQQDGSE
ncbi:Cell shape-determining protein MreC [Halomonadaceae bacterium LMG 33818]|uniref:rod shape-determining protein MreC n=1 Tax=Cernens ardua TaxID=3402176 RepID=UPI003EDC65E4